MKVMILGSGHVGKALAKQLKADGHSVVNTTTTEAKVPELKPLVDEVFVLKGSETEKVIEAAKGCDAMIVTVAPNVKDTRTVEERHIAYNEVLVKSCASAAKACPRVIFASSSSVYGDGGQGPEPISEDTPCSNHEEPSSKYYQLAEKEVLANEQGCVLRFPDMWGAPGDIDFPARVKMAHDYFGGNTIFAADVPLYCIHFEDVVNAILHALNKELSGIYNVVDNDKVPYTNQEIFDAICDEQGWERLGFTGAIITPNRKISADKFYATGYSTTQPDPNAAVVERHQNT